MQDNSEIASLKRLQSLRNIGPATAKRLRTIGISSPDQLRRLDPEKVYEKLRRQEGGKLDKCVLYQVRGAIKDVPWPECKDGDKRYKP